MSGWLHLVLGWPRVLYAHGLGGILGSRFLRLTHVGRRSGRRYDTVLEVLAHDTVSGEYVVLSGFGRDADWYRNLRAGGPVTITVGRRTWAARAHDLDPDEALDVMAAYERRNRLVAPVLHMVLSRLVGWRFRGTPTDRRRLVTSLPLVGLRPRRERDVELA